MAQAEKPYTPSVGWFIGGGVLGVGIYFLAKELFRTPTKLLRTGSDATQVMPLPPTAPPSRFVDLDSVDARFSQLRDLYHGGYKSADDTISEVNGLQAAAARFAAQDPSNKVKADLLASDLEAFKQQVIDAKQFIAQYGYGAQAPAAPQAG
jgi:hypothetical protein